MLKCMEYVFKISFTDFRFDYMIELPVYYLVSKTWTLMGNTESKSSMGIIATFFHGIVFKSYWLSRCKA